VCFDYFMVVVVVMMVVAAGSALAVIVGVGFGVSGCFMEGS
jgi:hypothetical protein